MQDTLASIDHQVHSVENLLHRLEARRLDLVKQLDGLTRRLNSAKRTAQYLAFCRWIRSPAASLELWPVALLVLGPLASAAFAFIVTHVVTGVVVLGLSMAIFSGLFAAAVLGWLLYLPSQHDLPRKIEESASELHRLRPARSDVASELDYVLREIQQNKSHLNELLASAEYKRRLLLTCNWKAMRGTEFEQFLARVLTEHGVTVHLTKASGDQGVDLVAQDGTRRIAIQAKGYVNSVGNSAVQQVVAGRVLYQCDTCAVITNSYFTPGAIELANAHGCKLIGEDEFTRFVMGQLRL